MQVILIEGRRKIPPEAHDQLRDVAAEMARAAPDAIFRSGNAEGSDTAFAAGVVSVDPSRMQYVMPTPNMGKKRRHPDGRVYSLSELPQVELDRLCELTIQATPKSERLARAAAQGMSGPLAAKGRYLLRDTLKVVGSTALELAPATQAFFYVDLSAPQAGGTGHTIRVCNLSNLHVMFQDDFLIGDAGTPIP